MHFICWDYFYSASSAFFTDILGRFIQFGVQAQLKKLLLPLHEQYKGTPNSKNYRNYQYEWPENAKLDSWLSLDLAYMGYNSIWQNCQVEGLPPGAWVCRANKQLPLSLPVPTGYLVCKVNHTRRTTENKCVGGEWVTAQTLICYAGHRCQGATPPIGNFAFSFVKSSINKRCMKQLCVNLTNRVLEIIFTSCKC